MFNLSLIYVKLQKYTDQATGLRFPTKSDILLVTIYRPALGPVQYVPRYLPQ
jgi:hypothetical protein